MKCCVGSYALRAAAAAAAALPRPTSASCDSRMHAAQPSTCSVPVGGCVTPSGQSAAVPSSCLRWGPAGQWGSSLRSPASRISVAMRWHCEASGGVALRSSPTLSYPAPLSPGRTVSQKWWLPQQKKTAGAQQKRHFQISSSTPCLGQDVPETCATHVEQTCSSGRCSSGAEGGREGLQSALSHGAPP